MQLHELKRRTKNKPVMLVGRGGKRGKTSGRGTKGQNARAGHKKRPEVRDIIKKLPKLRGYAFKSFAPKSSVVNVGVLEIAFNKGDKVDVTALIQKGLVSTKSGKMPIVKILGTGDITKALNIENCLLSAEAKVKIEKAGGKIITTNK
jgi:large subunit ribosomal protein L15